MTPPLTLEQARELLQAVLDCETHHDECGHAYLKVPARSLHDLGAAIAGALTAVPQEPPQSDGVTVWPPPPDTPPAHGPVSEATGRLTEIDRLNAALSTAPAPPQGWQPIATAPKDGTPIIIHTEGGLIGEARWQGEGSDEGWWWAGTDPGDYHSSRIEEYEVAHWMPLPAPPSAPTGETP